MIAVGYIVFALGCLICLVGELMFLAVVYKRSAVWFVGCLMLPIFSWMFFLLNLKATAWPFAIAIGGLVVAGLGGWMAGIEL
jgi:hypothetical protein